MCSRIERSSKVPILAVLLFSLCLYGCVRRPPARPTEPTPDLNRVLESVKQGKEALKSFRGIGTFKTVRRTGMKTVRLVWIGSAPQNLRVEALGPWGQPSLTFVINGSRFFFHSRQDNRYFKGDATVGNLSRFVSVPVRAEDLFGLLSGQPPILPFYSAKIRAWTSEGGWVLSLYRKWGRLIENIRFKDLTKGVEHVEVFDGQGNVQYNVAFSEFHQIKSLSLPHRIAISDMEGPRWSLTVERFWTEVSIPEGAYTLEVSGAQVTDLN